MRAFSAACGLWLKGAFIPGAFYKTKRPAFCPAPGAVLRKELLDGDPLLRGCLLLRQRQLEHAVVVLGLGLRLVQFLRQREAARDLAERTLGVEHALVLRDFLLPLDISGQRYLRAVDGDLDVFLPDARDLGGDYVGAVFLGHVDLHAGQLGAPFHREGTHQKALEQVIDQLVERIESGNVCHLLSPFLRLRYASCRGSLSGFKTPRILGNERFPDPGGRGAAVPPALCLAAASRPAYRRGRRPGDPARGAVRRGRRRRALDAAPPA